MIDDIIEMILKESRTRKIKDPVSRIADVMGQLNVKISEIMCDLREQERRFIDENKR